MNRQPAVQTATLIFGVLYLAVGVLGFLPFAHPNGALIGIFKVNAILDLVHAVIGVAGLAAAASVSNSRTYDQLVGIVLLALGLLGVFAPRPLGLVDLGGADIALHLVSGAILAYFGFLATVVTRR